METKEKKIRVVPIVREGSWLSSIAKNHDGAFMFTGTYATYTVPQTQDGKLINPLRGLEQDEIKELEKSLGLEDGELNPFRQPKNNFWMKNKMARVKLNKDGLLLDLSNPHDYVRYLVLKSDSEKFAPSWKERFDKGTYRFALSDSDQETKDNSKKADLLKRSYIMLGKLEDSSSKMKGILRINIVQTKGQGKVPVNATKEFLVSEVNKIIEESPRRFLEIVEDKDFAIKSDVSAAIEQSKILKVGKAKYQFADMVDDTFTYDEVIKYLKAPENSERYLELKNAIDK